MVAVVRWMGSGGLDGEGVQSKENKVAEGGWQQPGLPKVPAGGKFQTGCVGI